MALEFRHRRRRTAIVLLEIRECTDNRRLRTMLRRALRVTKAEDVLTRKRLPTAG